MNSSKTIFLLAVMALIMLFVYPIQPMSINEHSARLPIRHKRWTFNTWRLHGRRQLPNDFSSSKGLPLDDDHQDAMYNDEDDIARIIHKHLSQYVRKYNRQ